MKKFILLLLILVPIKVNASMVVMDMDTKRVLYEENMNKKDLIASTTKILTALIVLNNETNLNKEIEVGREVLTSHGSNIYIEVGERIKVNDLLYGLLLRSGNDAAIVLANYYGGSMEGFSILMNELASSLNMNDSNFINSTGLENEKGIGNTSTPYDMALLMTYASKNKTIMKIMSTKRKVVKTNFKTYDWYNKNKLLTSYKYTTGGKTGYTKKSYRTLVTSAKKDNINLTVVTLREKDDFNKHKEKYEYIFSNYKKEKVLNKKIKNDLCIKNDFYMLLKKDELKKVKINIYETNDAINRYGYISVSLDNKEYYKENLIKCENKDNIIKKFVKKIIK